MDISTCLWILAASLWSDSNALQFYRKFCSSTFAFDKVVLSGSLYHDSQIVYVARMERRSWRIEIITLCNRRGRSLGYTRRSADGNLVTKAGRSFYHDSKATQWHISVQSRKLNVQWAEITKAPKDFRVC